MPKTLNKKFLMWRQACASMGTGIPKKGTSEYNKVKKNYDDLLAGKDFRKLTHKKVNK